MSKKRNILIITVLSALIIFLFFLINSIFFTSKHVLPLGDSFLVPLGRSSEVNIIINEEPFHYDSYYDGYGGFWAKIPSGQLEDFSRINIRYIRRSDVDTSFHDGDEIPSLSISASYFIDSDNDSIRDQAQKIYNSTLSIKQNVTAFSDFICDNLKFNVKFHMAPASIRASQTLSQREGVCINFTRLFIALCRASGIPARSVTGIVLAHDQTNEYDFMHEWAEYMDENGKWHQMDFTYSRTSDLADLRYTDLVYAAEDHIYFKECTNKSLKTGYPMSLENNDIILYNYHPIFPGGKYGFKLIEDKRPDYMIIEKEIDVTKKGNKVIIEHVID